MNARLIALGNKVDALSLRERAMVFVAAAAAILFVVYSLMLGPLFAKEKALRTQIAQVRNNISGIDGEISAKLQGFSMDPDAPNRARLAKVKADIDALGGKLRALEQGLVAPERIAPLLETILASNGRLTLVSMKTLPATPVAEASYATTPTEGSAQAPAALLYRHGVQVTVRGNYLDMINYMHALETMPTQLLWSSAALEVEEYPDSRLTLTLHTLSLDRKWMKL
jgi:MSHA biogenesis protein MshJ